MILYTVYDVVAEECGPIFEAKNDAIARRQFDNMLQSQRVAYPKDYELHCIGFFDREKIKLSARDISRKITLAAVATEEMNDLPFNGVENG